MNRALREHPEHRFLMLIILVAAAVASLVGPAGVRIARAAAFACPSPGQGSQGVPGNAGLLDTDGPDTSTIQGTGGGVVDIDVAGSFTAPVEFVLNIDEGGPAGDVIDSFKLELMDSTGTTVVETIYCQNTLSFDGSDNMLTFSFTPAAAGAYLLRATIGDTNSPTPNIRVQDVPGLKTIGFETTPPTTTLTSITSPTTDNTPTFNYTGTDNVSVTDFDCTMTRSRSPAARPSQAPPLAAATPAQPWPTAATPSASSRRMPCPTSTRPRPARPSRSTPARQRRR